MVLWQSYDCHSACEVTLKVYCRTTVYPKSYAHGFVVLCFVVVMQSFLMNSHEVFIHIHQGCFAGTGAIVRLPQCQWSEPDGYGKISQCITTTKHNKAKTVCIFLGIYCMNTNALSAMNTKCCVPLTCTFSSFCLAFNVLWLWLLLYLGYGFFPFAGTGPVTHWDQEDGSEKDCGVLKLRDVTERYG